MKYNGRTIECTVKELREILNKFNDEDIVEVFGGEDAKGEFTEMWIGETPVCSDDEGSLF